MSVYKPCDIRGPVTELSGELYRSWGHSITRRVKSGGCVYVGGDVRLSTPGFAAALIEGLQEGGAVVHDLGVVPTPLVYFAGRQHAAAACAVVTASHSPPQINGLKWVIGELPPTEEMVQAFRQEAESGLPAGGPSAGSVQQVDITAEYLDWMQQQVPLWARLTKDVEGVRQRLASMAVVLDPGNGCWAGRGLGYFQKLFPNTKCLAIHDVPDGTFPERNPDSARPEHLAKLSARVRSEKADLGVAFDGDGDRVSFVDHTGVVLTAEQATWVFLQEFGVKLEDRPVVYDIKFSDLVADTVKQFGGVPLVERSGHAFIRTRMLQTAAVFGAEVSGHYFYGGLRGGDDGFYTASRIAWHLAASGQRLAELRQGCPEAFLTPDLRLPMDPKEMPQVLARTEAAFRDRPVNRTDGVRIDFPQGWALIRASVTEPALTFRFEGRNREALANVIAEFCGALGPLGEELARRYRQGKEADRETD